ncbi:MAG: four-carbon acid sugar kinase family protein [Candidatus Gastranaerophilales bacterium]|nr:four-carbon acid sugar kinase family protein [Candidatus Gastranaerophilales bacterium]
MALLNSTTIIADDLTGANDTALQYFKKGCSSRVVIDFGENIIEADDVDVWSISTESRNVEKEVALERIIEVANKVKELSKSENYYKKIDSTLRGNTGLEIVALLEALEKDVAIVAPAYPEENRTTVGGYQLLNGVPIERTQCALDPKSPIYDSCIADILKKDLNPQLHTLIGNIEFNTVVKGAGPIILKLNELVQKGKKIIIIDAISNTDLEQIALAIDKSQYDILPCGSAGLAQAMSNKIGEDIKNEHVENIPKCAKLILSGSATQLCANQIQKLKEERTDIFYVDLTIEDIIKDIDLDRIDQICEKLNSNVDVVIHCSMINEELKEEDALNKLIDAGIAKADFPGKITDFLANILYEINHKSNFILIMVGGETSFKCAQKINSSYLEILDAIAPAIPLCIDANGKIITTKSGNFGTNSTLIEILNYFDRFKHEQL